MQSPSQVIGAASPHGNAPVLHNGININHGIVVATDVMVVGTDRGCEVVSASLRENDLITGVSGYAVRNVDELSAAMRQCGTSTVYLHVEGEGRARNGTIPVGVGGVTGGQMLQGATAREAALLQRLSVAEAEVRALRHELDAVRR